MLKKNVDCLGSSLSQCIMDHKRLEFMFRKKHTPHMHEHHSRHTHAHHAHTHDSLYARMYTCTHCCHKDHLAKFYYDRIHALNFASKNIWVRRATNPHGLKKVWVPRTILISFNVGMGSHKTWENWCLGGGCVWAKWTQHWMHRYQGVLVEGPPYFWRLKD